MATQKLNQTPSIANDFVIAGLGSSAGISVLTDGPYASYLSLDHQNKMAGLRMDNTNGAVHILSQGAEVLRYNPTSPALQPAKNGAVDLGAQGKAFRKLYAHSGEVNTAPESANDVEIVNAKWVRRFIANSAVRRAYNATISGTADGHTDKTMMVDGTVTAYADGRIVQTFHIKDMSFIWFVNEDSTLAEGQGSSRSHAREITLNLWTAMPNEIVDVRPESVRASNSVSSVNYGHEAAEIKTAWSIFEQKGVRSRVVINLARLAGGDDEKFDLFVVVEGY